MTDQEQQLVYELNSTEADRILWKTTAIKQGNEIAALKAQVNCLRKAALDAISYMTGGEAKASLRDAYDATPEQCLAEVKAGAIRAMQKELETFGAVFNDGNGKDWHEVIKHSDVIAYVFKLREQAK